MCTNVQITESSQADLRQQAGDIADVAFALAQHIKTVKDILEDYNVVHRQLSSGHTPDDLVQEYTRIKSELVLELRREINRQAGSATPAASQPRTPLVPSQQRTTE